MKRKRNIFRKAAAGILAMALAVSMIPAGSAEAANSGSASGRELLGMTLTYCEDMDTSGYTEESYAAFQEVLSSARSAYDGNILSDEDYYKLRDTLEKAKAALVFTSDPEDTGNPLPFRELSVDEIVAEMGTGWNLGNTMDGHTGFTPNETLWQDVETTKELMKAVHDMGFNTVRVPVTWGTMINDEDYSIDEKWISRVQDIVDYAISEDMYVIINVHHDGAEQTGWLRVAADDIDSVYEKYEGVWRTIAYRFRDYDEHLIFESMNEVTGDNTTTVAHDTAVIMNLNQIFVNVVRSTGSNNRYRFLSVPGRYTNIAHTTDPANGFKLPEDTVENRIFVAVHYYDWKFGMVENTSVTTWNYSAALSLQNDFEKLVDSFTSQGIPVIVGEYGCINKNNSEDRAYHVEVVNRISAQSGVVPVYWDQGWYDKSAEPADFSYTLVDRNTGETIDKEVTDAIMRGMFVSGAADLADITLGTTVTEITGAALPDRVNLEIGQSEILTAVTEPAENNDVLLWSTDDSAIATVYNGHIRGRGIGSTTIHAYSQSGSYEKTITVTVTALEKSCENESITTAYDDGVTLEEGNYVYLDASYDGTPEENGGGEGTFDTEFLTYKSSDESVVTVSTTGKIVAKQAGTAYITITLASGLTKVIPVTVEKSADVNEIRLALNVYFNDSDNNYFSNEYGQAIRVTEDGQYELTFDCAADLSDNAKAAGVTGLNNLTAVYIKDQSVTEGSAKVSPLDSCNIFYNSVIVDGVELTVTQTDPKSALKASGILDTNDPLNSWDGSQVAEVTVNNHVLNIEGIDNPQKITVVFTLSDMVFTEGAAQDGAAEAAQVEQINVPETMPILEDSDEFWLELTIDGEDGAKLMAVPADASIVAINTTAVTVENGTAGVWVVPLKPGTTTITVYADDGTSASFETVNEATLREADEVIPETADTEEMQEEAPESNEEDGENTEKEEGVQEEAATENKKDKGTNWVLVVLLIAAAAVAAGFIGYFAANKFSATGKDKKDGEEKDKTVKADDQAEADQAETDKAEADQAERDKKETDKEK